MILTFDFLRIFFFVAPSVFIIFVCSLNFVFKEVSEIQFYFTLIFKYGSNEMILGDVSWDNYKKN